VLALPLAWERERATRMMGLRTFPLVAVASCGFILVGTSVVGDNPDANSRLLGGLMSGIGFIGGGAILKHGHSVHGTATAASIWATGVLGVAVGYGAYEVAILVSVVTLLILIALKPLERIIDHPRDTSRDDPGPD
jgi:putative Mg2+ transporter-C (MgtC) family protein